MSFSRDTKTFLLYAVVFSLVIVSGPLSSRFQLPSIPPVWGANDAGFGSWYPAGPQMQTLSISTFTDSTAQITALQTSQIDLTDWPLTPGQIPTVCPTVAINCSSPVLENGYSGIQFNLAGNFWGVPMSYGNNPAGIQIRQGIAHLIDKISFAGNECGGQTCVADDDPTPVCNTFNNPVGTINPPCELPAANPCAWDSMFAEPPTPGVCEVGAPGGTSYHLAPAAGVNFPWQPAYASPDFNV